MVPKLHTLAFLVICNGYCYNSTLTVVLMLYLLYNLCFSYDALQVVIYLQS